ncbi:hypothetical protein LCGC14_0541920 [marine sediment metagenome]|uniref:Uncharacterized protein n=1 Tax=marine sediment metagenome TaxID=412755 RepID=A0A0F9RSP6_9ZZZZ
MKKLFVILILILLVTSITFGQQKEVLEPALEQIKIEMDKLKEEIMTSINPDKLYKGSKTQELIIKILDDMYLIMEALVKTSIDIEKLEEEK